MRYILSVPFLLAALSGCSEPKETDTEREIRRIAALEPERTVGPIEELLKDEVRHRPTVLRLLWDPDPDVRTASSVFLAQSKEKFSGVDVVKFWTTYDNFESNSDYTGVWIARLVAKERNENSRSLLVSYLKTGRAKFPIVRQYALADPEAVARLIVEKKLSDNLMNALRKHLHRNPSQAIDAALKEAAPSQ